MKFDRFLQEACPPLNLQWRKYRRKAARHRVDGRMKELDLHEYAEYLRLLQANPREAHLFPDLMRVTVTRFFREQDAWRELQELLSGIISRSGDGGTFRAWSAGCCGGEEPYSLALLWLHYLLPMHPRWSLRVIATDIDAASLERARHARYHAETLREVPVEIRQRWFSKAEGFWHVDEQAISLVTFDNSNLLTDPPPSEIDLVLCRYLPFTYYQDERLLAAAKRLRQSLKPGGLLMIGAKETLPPPALELFEPLPGSGFFYRRRD